MAVADPELLARVSQDRALASVLLFAHRHPQREAEMHIEIMDLLRAADEFVVLEAFREAGKTTKLEEHTILAGCFGNFNYCLLIGETYEKACQRLAAIEYECRTNEALASLFGGPILSRRAIENKLWFASGAFIQALGWEQELQSFKHLAHRPDYAILDDVENLERVRDAEAVDASMTKLYTDLLPAMDKERRKIVNSQTRRAEDCMVTRLASNPEWLYRGFPIATGDIDDPKTRSNWPARYPMEWIRHEKRRYQASGMLPSFMQAYMLQAGSLLTKPFKLEHLTAWEMSPYHWMPRFAIYDPSRSNRETKDKHGERSDRTGKVVVSRLGSKILVHESSGNYWAPDQLVDDLFSTQENHAPVKIGLEQNSLNDWLLQPIRIEILRRGVPLPLQALNAPQDRSKDEFIMGLQPFALARDIVLIGGTLAHPQLVAEWQNFPQGPRDVLNALAYSLRMFSGVPMYEDFGGANIGEAATPRPGETVYLAWNAAPSEVVAVALLRDGRRLTVAADFGAAGALADAIKTVAFEVKASFPRNKLQSWVPAELFEAYQRIALVPALRNERLTPYRGEQTASARGCLAERIRTTWHNNRLLLVDRGARRTLNALAAGYCLAAEKGGRLAQLPEEGPARLIAEGIECLVAALDRAEKVAPLPDGANIAHTPSGHAYVSANPRRVERR